MDCVAQIKQVNADEIIKEAGTKRMGQTSIKAALDIDWSDAQEKRSAINILLKDVDALRIRLNKQPASLTNNWYLKEALLLLETVLTQNIDPDPSGGSRVI